jgi:hypothetical protein
VSGRIGDDRRRKIEGKMEEKCKISYVIPYTKNDIFMGKFFWLRVSVIMLFKKSKIIVKSFRKV